MDSKIHQRGFPTVLASSVIRSTWQGESHGGLYLVNLENNDVKQVLDWNTCSISWEGRGADRGLRGIAFFNDEIFIAASDEIFIFDKTFSIKGSIRNKYLRHCHEIYIHKGVLYLTSTWFDSILEFDILSQRFRHGYCLRKARYKLQNQWKFSRFDPTSNKGPVPEDTCHINNVFCENNVIYFTGSGLDQIFTIQNGTMRNYCNIPRGSHNARPYKDGVLLNSTKQESIQFIDCNGEISHSFSIPRYRKKELLNADLPEDHARQAFARGLCVYENQFVIGGSSPATISIYDFENTVPLKTITLTYDVRNAIHGLEVWPPNF